MGQKVQALLDNIAEVARANTGIALIEVWMCEKCGVECYRVHPMLEVIECGNCGQRHASKLPRYQAACEAGANAEIAFKEPPYDPGEPHL